MDMRTESFSGTGFLPQDTLHAEFGVENARIAVIGLGYVGLPLAVEFGRYFPTVGFDINAERISDLRKGHDNTRQIEYSRLTGAEKLRFSHLLDDVSDCNVYIVSVPTPIDRYKRPDTSYLLEATRSVGSVLSTGNVVIFESTVYPGATEELCVPILERESDLVFNQGFFVGYSPERINPGDREHDLAHIVKVTSGSTPKTADFVDALYKSIIAAGTHKVSSIRVAEAAKVIENTQRDVNIALVNELAMLFHELEIDCNEVLKAAATKWNFLPFKPGLVGGHCIGVDPYYLTHKAQSVGFHPEMILAGRRINDTMGNFIADTTVKSILERDIELHNARVLVLGFTFKENCPDIRNTRVIDVVRGLQKYGVAVDIHDPWADDAEVLNQYGVMMALDPAPGCYDGIIVAVAHEEFRQMGAARIRRYGKASHVLFDLKSIFESAETDIHL